MKVGIVTGGTKGIGLSVVRELIDDNFFVITTYSSDEAAAASLKQKYGNNIFVLKMDQGQDISREIALIRNIVLSRGGVIDVLICNTGATIRKKLTEITNKEWETVFNCGLNSHFYIIRDMFDCLKSESRIIFIGSTMALYPHSTSIAYGTMKSAVHALALNLVKFFEGTGTTVNVVAPGFVETEWQKNKPADIRP